MEQGTLEFATEEEMYKAWKKRFNDLMTQKWPDPEKRLENLRWHWAYQNSQDLDRDDIVSLMLGDGYMVPKEWDEVVDELMSYYYPHESADTVVSWIEVE